LQAGLAAIGIIAASEDDWDHPGAGRPIRRPDSVAVPNTVEPGPTREGFAGFPTAKMPSVRHESAAHQGSLRTVSSTPRNGSTIRRRSRSSTGQSSQKRRRSAVLEFQPAEKPPSGGTGKMRKYLSKTSPEGETMASGRKRD
jgi:hypothetical protein